MKTKIMLLVFMLTLGSFTLSAYNRECIEVIEEGKIEIVQGTLSSEDGNTYITSGRDKYLVYRGPGMFSYKDGAEVTLEGWVYKMQIMPTKIKIEGVEINLHRKGPRRNRGRERDCEGFREEYGRRKEIDDK